MSNLISMDDRISKKNARAAAVRDRRYAIRHPFAADAELLDLESGLRATGVTSDLSLGGCFVCTSKPLAVGSRVKITLSRKAQTIEALAVVRIMKPRVGMGVEFLDVVSRDLDILARWIDALRHGR